MKIQLNYSKIVVPALVLIAAAGNILLWYYGRGISFQVSTIAFVVVWLNFVLAIFTYKRLPSLSYILFGAVLVLELLLAVDLFWIIGRIL